MKDEEEAPLKNTDVTGQLAQYQQVSIMLKEFVVKNGLSVKISGKDYINVEGWQFLGGIMRLTAIVLRVKDISEGKHLNFRAEVELYNWDMQKIGYCTSTCSNQERRKKNFEPYALESMAQTRALGKIYRLRLGFIAKMAGFEATPLEEIPEQAIAKDIKHTIKPIPEEKEQIQILQRQIKRWLDNEEEPTWITERNRQDIANIDWGSTTLKTAKHWYSIIANNSKKATLKQTRAIKQIIEVGLFSNAERQLILHDIENIGSSIASKWISQLKQELADRIEANEGEEQVEGEEVLK